jgi:hypothetical protein
MRACAVVAAIVVAVTLPGGWAEAGGPWKGQVLDAETGQPLSGAVVLAAFWKRSPGAVHERRDFYEAMEVVTDDEGRFVIPPVKTFTLTPFTRIQGPDIKIFKGGYGQWQFRNEPPILKSDIEERKAWLEKAWKRFEGEGVIIELPPLKTREKRRKFHGFPRPDPDIPRDRVQNLLRALEEEDRWLGIRRAPRY